jgi:hypothetical protein
MTQASQPQDPPPARTDRSPWNWLLLVPIVLPLITVIYNRDSPRLFGWPFFFWFQVMFTLLAAAITANVFVATRPRS